MPGQDGTGPRGLGSRTGRGLGPCGGGIRRGAGRGFGMGRGMGPGKGFGRGTGLMSPVALTREEEKKILEAELKEIDLEKQEIEERLKEMG